MTLKFESQGRSDFECLYFVNEELGHLILQKVTTINPSDVEIWKLICWAICYHKSKLYMRTPTAPLDLTRGTLKGQVQAGSYIKPF